MGQSGEVRECEGHSLCVTGTQECKFGREMVQVLCGVFERELEWGVCVCLCVCVCVCVSAPRGWATLGITCPWVSSHAKPDCSNTQADQVQPVLSTSEG